MDQNKKEHKKHYKVYSRPIINFLIGLGAFSLILFVSMLTVAGDTRLKRSGNSGSTAEEKQQTAVSDTETMLAVVKEINTEDKLITLFNIEKQETTILFYNGGTDIRDKYGKLMTISQIQPGAMVDAAYQKSNNKLVQLGLSTKAWEYVGVNNFSIDRYEDIMKIASTKYKYTKDVTVIDGLDFIEMESLAQQDLLTVRGYEETIWSVTVTRGHGTVRLEDYEKFLGANITIGYESMQQIVEDLEITVREGDFSLTVENGEYSATKSITVKRNEVTYVSLSDLGPAVEQGRINFDITPFGADLFIDGELLSYANPIELEYGEHSLVVSLGGYTSYQGTLTVDSASKTLKINLPERSSNKSAIVTETEDSSDSASGSGNTQTPMGDSTGTEAEDTSSDSSEIVDKDHKIYIQNPSGASVYLDGDFMCIAPGSFKKVIGDHVITFIMEGYETISYTIEVTNDGLDAYYTFPNMVKED